MRRRTIAIALWLTFLASPASADEGWATKRARSLTTAGAQNRAAGKVDLALTQLREAIQTDATFGDAYLTLAELREATGELDEAERVLVLGMDHIPGFVEAMLARAELLARARRDGDASSAFLEALRQRPDDEAVLRRLVAIAPRAGLLPVALGAARRLAALARGRADDKTARELFATTRALSMLVAEVDPALAGGRSPERARRALARFAGGR